VIQRELLRNSYRPQGKNCRAIRKVPATGSVPRALGA